jgi:hypothetical protein
MSATGVLAETIDRSCACAVYKQVADHLRRAIAQGRVADAEQTVLRDRGIVCAVQGASKTRRRR